MVSSPVESSGTFSQNVAQSLLFSFSSSSQLVRTSCGAFRKKRKNKLPTVDWVRIPNGGSLGMD